MTGPVRVAALADMPIIHSLISDSFAAMKKFVDPEVNYENDVKNLIEKGDLSPINFENTYLKPPNSNYWVIEHPDTKEVCGCVALTQSNPDEAELKRMAVSPVYRGQNFGGILMSNLLKFAAMKGFQRILLTTANPDSMRFYLKHQFAVYQSFEFKMKTTTLAVYKMVHYVSEKLINRISIVGGTHGNERIGVQLVKEWQTSHQHELSSRSALSTTALYGNIKAIALNQRFFESDLNRQFTLNENDGSFKPVEEVIDTNKQTYESVRAIELNDILGPKLKQTGPTVGGKDSLPLALSLTSTTAGTSGTDFIIDLHSTECDVGTLLMISGEEDCLAYRVAYHIQSMEAYKDVHITCSRGNKDNSYSVDSLSPSGLAIEVGPLPHGTINEILLQRTRGIVLAILDYFESQNLKFVTKVQSSTLLPPPPLKQQKLDNTMVDAASNSDSANQTIPAVPVSNTDSVSVKRDFPKVNFFKYLGAVHYPEVTAPYESVILHPSFSSGGNHELKPLKNGDITFQFQLTDNDGNNVIVTDCSFILDDSLVNQVRADRHNKELAAADIVVYPAFIGEPAYLKSDKAFYLYTLDERSIY